MTDPSTVLTPELEELLRDVAADPRAKLLRVGPRDVAIGLREGIEPVPIARARLTSAERHLLEAHRDEVAWLLREAFLRGHFANEQRSWRTEYDGSLEKVPAWVERATHALDTQLDASDRDALGLIRALLGSTGSSIRGAQLLSAALRLDPSPKLCLYLAHDHIASQATSSARVVLRRLEVNRPPEDLRPYLSQAWAMVCTAESAYREADHQYELSLAATQDSVVRLVSRISQLHCAAVLGDVQALQRIADELDELSPQPSQHAKSMAVGWRRLKAKGRLVIIDASVRRLRERAENAATGTRMLIDALLS